MSFPQPLLSTVNNQLHGRIFSLLDPKRDANFLNRPTTDALGNTIPDMGLGVVDNGMFFYTSKFQPSDPSQPRPYPVKFFWLGSPAGTNDVTDNFSIFMADVDPGTFYAGAPASAWLVNPRLVLSIQQAKKDVIAWFDANYPGGAAGGVGSTNTGSNSQYGSLGGGSTPVGDISGMDSIDGQLHPIYDIVDQSLLLYFSVKTPNQNTLSIYCYKTPAGEGAEVTSPLASSQFQGGLAGPSWLSGTGQLGTYPFLSSVLSSHRFTLTAPDPLTSFPFSSGTLPAMFVYAGGTPGETHSAPDHGSTVLAGHVVDIHTNPVAPGSNENSSYTTTGGALRTIIEGHLYDYVVDKFGSMHVNRYQPEYPGYLVLYNAPSNSQDRFDETSPTTGKVWLSAMQVRTMYISGGLQAFFGQKPILVADGVDRAGFCRPQFTTLPDGLPKIVCSSFHYDQSLSVDYVYINEDDLSPAKQPLITKGISATQFMPMPSFGKKKVILRFYWYGSFQEFASGIIQVLSVTGTPDKLKNSGWTPLFTQGSSPTGVVPGNTDGQITIGVPIKKYHLRRGTWLVMNYGYQNSAGERLVAEIENPPPHMLIIPSVPGISNLNQFYIAYEARD